MLTVNPKERLTLKQVKRHPWVLEDLSVAVQFAPMSTRISPVLEPHPETLAELVTYGFSEADCLKTLTTEKKKHPVVSLYYLIDDARLRRERRWELECQRIEKLNHAIHKQNVISAHPSRSPSPIHPSDPPISIFQPIGESAAASHSDMHSNMNSPSPDQRTILQYLMVTFILFNSLPCVLILAKQSRRSPTKAMVAA